MDAISNAISSIILIATAVILFLTAWETRKARIDHNTLEILWYLQDENIRQARHVLIERLSKKNYIWWSDEEIKTAEKVCASYDAAGFMLHLRLIEEKLAFLWRDSIIKSWYAAKDMIKEQSDKRGKDYYMNFKEIFILALEYTFIYEMYKKRIKENKFQISITELVEQVKDEYFKDFKIVSKNGLVELTLKEELVEQIAKELKTKCWASYDEQNKEIALTFNGERKVRNILPPRIWLDFINLAY